MKRHQYSRTKANGFALPTVIITSVVMFGVLVAVLSMVTSASTSLSEQYFETQAADAAESGVAAAEACLQNDTFPDTTKTLTVATDCNGNNVQGRSAYIIAADGTNRPYQTKYTAQDTGTGGGKGRTIKVTGIAERLRPATGESYKTYRKVVFKKVAKVTSESALRATQRWWCFGYGTCLDFGASGSALPTARIVGMDGTNDVPEPGYNLTVYDPYSFNHCESSSTVSDTKGKLVYIIDGCGDTYKRNIYPDDLTMLKNNADMSDDFGFGPQAVITLDHHVATRMWDGTAIYQNILNTSSYDVPPSPYKDSKSDTYIGILTQNDASLFEGGVLNSYSYQALGAMPKSNSDDYYVYVMNKKGKIGTIYRYLMKDDTHTSDEPAPPLPKPTKITMTPAPIICGSDPDTLTGKPTYGMRGTITFSRDYKKMLLLTGAKDCGDGRDGTAYLYATDATTGNVTLQASWVTHNSAESETAYSADFSPEGKYVYVTSINPSHITRYNIQDLANIQNSEWKIGTTTDIKYPSSGKPRGGMVKVGPDNRMWLANGQYYNNTPGFGGPNNCKLSYINNPDATKSTTDETGIALKKDSYSLVGASCGSMSFPSTVMTNATETRLVDYTY